MTYMELAEYVETKLPTAYTSVSVIRDRFAHYDSPRTEVKFRIYVAYGTEQGQAVEAPTIEMARALFDLKWLAPKPDPEAESERVDVS